MQAWLMSEAHVPAVIDRAALLARAPGPTWSRAAILEAAGFAFIDDVRRAIEHDRAALAAVQPDKRVHKRAGDGTVYVEWTEGGAPDWDTRHKAAEHLYELADVRRARDLDLLDAQRPVSVTLVLTGSDPRVALPAGGVTLHLSGGESG